MNHIFYWESVKKPRYVSLLFVSSFGTFSRGYTVYSCVSLYIYSPPLPPARLVSFIVLRAFSLLTQGSCRCSRRQRALMNRCRLVLMVAHVYCHNPLCNVAAWDTRTVAQSLSVVRDRKGGEKKKKRAACREENVTA